MNEVTFFSSAAGAAAAAAPASAPPAADAPTATGAAPPKQSKSINKYCNKMNSRKQDFQICPSPDPTLKIRSSMFFF